MEKISNYNKALRIFKSLPLPLQRFIMGVLRALNIKKEKYYRDLRYKGKFLAKVNTGAGFYIDSQGASLENLIYWYGIKGYEPESVFPWAFLSKKSTVILDIGANIGIYSLIAKAENPNAQVHSFEPSDIIYSKMVANYKLNKFNDIVANKTGISNTTGQLLFYDYETGDHTSASFAIEKINSNNTPIKKIEHVVEVVTIDDYIALNKLAKVDLIKIDVELYEKEVLEGATQCLQTHRPVVIFEVLTEAIAINLAPIFTTANYKLFHLKYLNGKFEVTPVDKLFLDTNEMWNFLAVPAENNTTIPGLNSYLSTLN